MRQKEAEREGTEGREIETKRKTVEGQGGRHSILETFLHTSTLLYIQEASIIILMSALEP